MKRIVFVLAVLCTSAWAQNDTPKTPGAREFFRLDFVLKETEGSKLLDTRSFQMMVPTDEKAVSSIRSGDKIPVPAVGAAGTTIYIDVGVNLDVQRLHRINEELTLDIVAQVSNADGGSNIVHEAKWNSTVLIPIRKSVVIFSSDAPASKRQLQLEVTATPIH